MPSLGRLTCEVDRRRLVESINVVGTTRRKYWKMVNAVFSSEVDLHTLSRALVGHVERLSDRGKEWPKRKFVDDMGKVHQVVIGMLETHIPVP